MALSSTYAKLVALLMAALLIMTPAVLAQSLEHESFDDAWEVALLDDSPRSLGRRALLDRYKPPKDDHDHDHRGDDDDKPGKGHDKDNDNKDKDKHKSKKSKGKKKDD